MRRSCPAKTVKTTRIAANITRARRRGFAVEMRSVRRGRRGGRGVDERLWAGPRPRPAGDAAAPDRCEARAGPRGAERVVWGLDEGLDERAVVERAPPRAGAPRTPDALASPPAPELPVGLARPPGAAARDGRAVVPDRPEEPRPPEEPRAPERPGSEPRVGVTLSPRSRRRRLGGLGRLG
ncbi:hypothetical protein GCM10009826_15820 [Humibacillus xanthopallidus]